MRLRGTAVRVVFRLALTALAAAALAHCGSDAEAVGTPTPQKTTAPPFSAEPPDMEIISNRGFFCVQGAPCESSWGVKQYVPDALTIVVDSTAPRSPPTVGRITFPAGFVGGETVARTCRVFNERERKKTLYVSTWIQLSPEFEGHPLSFISKILYVYINGHNSDIAIEAQGASLDPLQPLLVFQSLAAPYPDSYGVRANTVGRIQNVSSGVQIVRGKWHHFEFVLAANTPGIADGSVEAWQDTVKTFDLRNITFVPENGTSVWTELCWDPVWGGIGGVVEKEFYMQMDHIYISGK